MSKACNLQLIKCVLCELTGCDHGQMSTNQASEAQSGDIGTTTGHSPTANGSPPNSEGHSSQIATDADVPSVQAAESSPPAADDVAVDQQAPTVDARTEPEQCPAETDDYLSPSDPDSVVKYDQQSEGTATNPLLTPTADLHTQPAVDSEAESQHFAEHNEHMVPGQAAELSHDVVEQPEPAVDGPSDKTESEQPPPVAAESFRVEEHNQQAEYVSVQSGPSIIPMADLHVQPVVNSEINPQQLAEHDEDLSTMVDETVLDSDSELSEPQSVDQHELHDELTDSYFDSSVDKLQTPDQRDRDTTANDAQHIQPTVGSDHSVDDDIIQQHIADEHMEEQTGELRPELAESHQTDSQQHNIDRNQVPVQPDDAVDEWSPSDNLDVHLTHEGMIENTMDEHVTVPSSKDSATGYLAPVIYMWAATDAWLKMCIDSVSSSKCVSSVTFIKTV